MSSFILIVYADLKKFKFYYWFAFPVLTLPNVSMELRCLRNETYFEVYYENQLLIILTILQELKESISKFFIVERKLLSFLWNSVTKECYELNELSQLTDNDHFCVIDSSGSADFPGMAVRNVIAYAKLRFNASKISIICVRNEIFNLNPTYESSSLLLTFFMPEEIGIFVFNSNFN